MKMQHKVQFYIQFHIGKQSNVDIKIIFWRAW
jgi:hypothetical protein